MAPTVAHMTPEELREMIATCVEEAVDRQLTAILGDPDLGLEVRPEIVERLRVRKDRVAAGEMGRPLSEIAKELGWQM